MSGPRKDNGLFAALTLIAVLVVIVLPVLYVLSIGPAFWMERQGWISRDSFETAYHPLFSLARDHPLFRSVLGHYAALWWRD